jgi:hypothetical protein
VDGGVFFACTHTQAKEYCLVAPAVQPVGLARAAARAAAAEDAVAGVVVTERER